MPSKHFPRNAFSPVTGSLAASGFPTFSAHVNPGFKVPPAPGRPRAQVAGFNQAVRLPQVPPVFTASPQAK